MAKGPKEIIVEGRNILELSWTALEKLVVQMTFDLLLERGERTKTRKECDIMRTCWQNSEKDLQEAKAKLLKKYLDGDVLWEKHKKPYEEKEQEITYQKFIMNYTAQFEDKENQKRMEMVNKRWEEEVLPTMIEEKTEQAVRFDQKQEELNKEYNEVQIEYQDIIDEAVRVLDDKLLDRRTSLSRSLWIRKKYNDLQFLMKQLSVSEQKNLLINDLNAGHKINFEKTRSFLRERIEGDIAQIVSLSSEITKVNEYIERTSHEIKKYNVMIANKQTEFERYNKTVKLYELRLNTYKKNVDKAHKCSKKIDKLNEDISAFEKRSKELTDEIDRRQKEKQWYIDLIEKVRKKASKLQKKFFGEEFKQAMVEHKNNLTEFERLFREYGEHEPAMARSAHEQFSKQKMLLQELPFLITKEIKGHNDFIESAMVKLNEIGQPCVPTFVRVTEDKFPTGTGAAGLTNI